MRKLPHLKTPCKQCPFRKTCRDSWLGKKRAIEIVESSTFTCHKTGEDTDRLQCAGHLLVAHRNTYRELAVYLKLNLFLKGKEVVFDTPRDFINHHKNK